MRCQGPKKPWLLRDRPADGGALGAKIIGGLRALYAESYGGSQVNSRESDGAMKAESKRN